MMDKEMKSQNNRDALAQKLVAKALELGFEQCGIIRVEEVEEFAERLAERIEAFPETKLFYDAIGVSKYAAPQQNYDWAKSIIVCVRRYGKYKIPKGLDEYIGKLYLYDYKFQKYSEEYTSITSFESYLQELGIRAVKETLGITAGRMAALKAGLGVIRKNNFLYTKSGSWVWLEMWLTDAEMEYKATEALTSCPENCTNCLEACPTGALVSPYAMNMAKCVTRLTYSPKGIPPEHLRSKMGKWLYGCDACQNACPMNKGKWEETEEYPNLDKVANHLSLESLAELDEKTFTESILPKFWYINKDRIWMWKCNALRAMANDYHPKYAKYIKDACDDSNEQVREIALWAREKVKC